MNKTKAKTISISEMAKLFYSRQGIVRLASCYTALHGNGISVRGMYNRIFRIMNRSYRSEDFFKQSIFRCHLNNCRNPNCEVAFSEFQVGGSIADLMFCNGSITIYEIKTGLDNLDRLAGQLRDYAKVASVIWVVADDAFVDELVDCFRDTGIGIGRLDQNGYFEPFKPAKRDASRLDVGSLVSLLWKNELHDICRLYDIDIADDCLFGKRAREVLSERLFPEEAERLVRDALKKRKKVNLGFDKLPSSVQFKAYSLCETEYQSFCRLLSMKYTGGAIYE